MQKAQEDAETKERQKGEKLSDEEMKEIYKDHIVTGKQIGRAHV